jgi:hypothetical protein
MAGFQRVPLDLSGGGTKLVRWTEQVRPETSFRRLYIGLQRGPPDLFGEKLPNGSF